MPVRTDLALLGQRIQLPPGVERASWIVLPVGATSSAAPGPTDTQLVAFLKLSPVGWQAVGPSSRRQTVTLPSAAAGVVPAEALAGATRKGSDYTLDGEAFSADAFNLGSYRGQYAVRIGDGLLVSLQTQ